MHGGWWQFAEKRRRGIKGGKWNWMNNVKSGLELGDGSIAIIHWINLYTTNLSLKRATTENINTLQSLTTTPKKMCIIIICPWEARASFSAIFPKLFFVCSSWKMIFAKNLWLFSSYTTTMTICQGKILSFALSSVVVSFL